MMTTTTTTTARRWLLVGVGDAARTLCASHPDHLAQRLVTGTTRSAEKLDSLRKNGLAPLLFDGTPRFFDELRDEAAGARVLVSFPPATDPAEETRVAEACASASAIVYISSTGVFGDRRGVIDHDTVAEASGQGEAARRRLAAEAIYRSVGATILRAPALYDSDVARGLPQRLLGGAYRVPGDGSGYVSRLHLADLAQLIVAAWERAERGEEPATFLVGDATPSPHREVIAFLCDRLGLPFPASIPLQEAPVTLRGSRRVDASHALRTLGVTLRYPSFREGYAALGRPAAER